MSAAGPGRADLGDFLVERLRLTQAHPPDLEGWRGSWPTSPAQAAGCGWAGGQSMSSCHDAYWSVREALYHAGLRYDVAVEIDWIDAEEVEHHGGGTAARLGWHPGARVGFGERGIEGRSSPPTMAVSVRYPIWGYAWAFQVMIIDSGPPGTGQR